MAGRHKCHPASRDGLVFRHAWVDFVAPGEDAALDVPNVLEARFLEDAAGLAAADAAAAVHDDFIGRVQLAQALGQRSQPSRRAVRRPRSP